MGPVLLNKKGLTLVEVLISLIVLLILFLALMQTALLGIDSNARNLLRTEAVSIAEERLASLRNTPFANLTVSQATGVTEVTVEGVVSRDFRNFSSNFFPTRSITNINSSNKQVTISVTWTWKGVNYSHTASTIVRDTSA